jgi:hypothetical protein
VVISLLPERKTTWQIRRAVHIGRVKTFAELDDLMEKYEVFRCLISPQAEPHLVQEWARQEHYGTVYQVIYTNDGLSQPDWNYRERIVRVDRTYALDSAYAEIRARRWWLPAGAQEIDGGEFYAQLKAPTRVRDMTTGELRYRWSETGSLDHYRDAQVFDHLAGTNYVVPMVSVV